MSKDVVAKALSATANGPVVVVLGPMGIGVSLTPEAALESAEALLAAARDAIDNRAAGRGPE